MSFSSTSCSTVGFWIGAWCAAVVSSFGGLATQLMFREALALNSMGLSCSTHWCSVCFLQHFGLAQVRTWSHQVGHQCCKFARCMLAGGLLVSCTFYDNRSYSRIARDGVSLSTYIPIRSLAGASTGLCGNAGIPERSRCLLESIIQKRNT